MRFGFFSRIYHSTAYKQDTHHQSHYFIFFLLLIYGCCSISVSTTHTYSTPCFCTIIASVWLIAVGNNFDINQAIQGDDFWLCSLHTQAKFALVFWAIDGTRWTRTTAMKLVIQSDTGWDERVCSWTRKRWHGRHERRNFLRNDARNATLSIT